MKTSRVTLSHTSLVQPNVSAHNFRNVDFLSGCSATGQLVLCYVVFPVRLAAFLITILHESRHKASRSVTMTGRSLLRHLSEWGITDELLFAQNPISIQLLSRKIKTSNTEKCFKYKNGKREEQPD